MDELEKPRLKQLEIIIADGISKFAEAGKAFQEIRDTPGLLPGHMTFADYCEKRWGFKRSRVNQLIKASAVVHNLSTIVEDLSTTYAQPAQITHETQVRPVVILEPKEQIEVWYKVWEKYKCQPTEKYVKEMVGELFPPHRSSIELPEDIFNVIYADPAWEYRNSGFEMSAAQHYDTMATEQICAYTDDDGREIHEIIADNAVCLMWATNPLLPDGLMVMDAWGFEYKTNFAWVKERHTAGFYNFGKHELLLLGIKGTQMLPVEKYYSVIEGENKAHSKKPEIVYEMIEHMYPNHKYVEVFQREPRAGWAGVGNEL